MEAAPRENRSRPTLGRIGFVRRPPSPMCCAPFEERHSLAAATTSLSVRAPSSFPPVASRCRNSAPDGVRPRGLLSARETRLQIRMAAVCPESFPSMGFWFPFKARSIRPIPKNRGDRESPPAAVARPQPSLRGRAPLRPGRWPARRGLCAGSHLPLALGEASFPWASEGVCPAGSVCGISLRAARRSHDLHGVFRRQRTV